MVETIRLESGHTLTGIGGSNPSPSAIVFPYLGLLEPDPIAIICIAIMIMKLQRSVVRRWSSVVGNYRARRLKADDRRLPHSMRNSSIRNSWPATLLALFSVICSYPAPSFAGDQPKLTISRSEYLDRVRAIWTAQMIGQRTGAHFEHKPASVLNKYAADSCQGFCANR